MMKKLMFLMIMLMITMTSMAPSTRGNHVYEIKEITVTAPKISKKVLEKQIWMESRGTHMKNGKLLRSPAGAVGIAQFLPSTWKYLKKIKVLPSNLNINSQEDQLLAQKLFMSYLYDKDYGIKDNKEKLALASYNAGSGRVRRLIKKYGKDWEKYLPKETKKYIKLILS
jgi:soluble lytic murein transglycosylase-like protein